MASILNNPALLLAHRQWLFVSRFPSSQLNKANSFDTVVPFMDLDMSITNGIVIILGLSGTNQQQSATGISSPAAVIPVLTIDRPGIGIVTYHADRECNS